MFVFPNQERILSQCHLEKPRRLGPAVPSVAPLIFFLLLMQNIIAEHEIRNISCAAQDPEDLCTFAYITKDLQTSHHYCHVFSTVDVVSEQ